jgi:formylglycine-generating enzyme required for sulfatase activity
MVEIPGGPFTIDIESGSPDEGPAHEVDVAAFQMDKFAVTNADFATFVEATGYQPYPGNTQPDPFYGEQFRVIRGASALSRNRS